MAITSSTRTVVFHHLMLAPRNIHVFPNHKIQFLSTKSTYPPKFAHYESQNKKEFPLVSLLGRYGFSPSQISSFLEGNEFLLKSNLNDVKKSLCILSSFRFLKKSLVSLVSDCPRVLELEFLKKWQVVFLKVGNLGVSPLILRNVLEISRRFEIEPDRCLEIIRVLKGLGFSAGTVSKVLEEFPELIMKGTEILGRIEFLVGKGIPRNEIEQICNLHPGFLLSGAEDRLKPLFKEFQELGFSDNEVCKDIIKEPRILGTEVGELSRCVQLLRTLKCRMPIKEKIFSEGVFRAAFNVKLRVDCLCKHGLTGREAFKILWKEPRLILYNIDDIEKKIEFLVNRMNCNVGCLVEIPEYLGVNFDKQIVPRFNVIDCLKSKGALGFEAGLRDLIKPCRLRFYNLYVKPYPECEKIFGRFIGDVEIQRQHLGGLRNLFKPQRYTDSKEDLKNMKSFVESLV